MRSLLLAHIEDAELRLRAYEDFWLPIERARGDGETAPLDVAYSSYGVEPLDGRRWTPGSPMSLAETIEQRFLFTCGEVRRRNITVWLIGFGTQLTDVMRQCAGEGHYFEAADAAELNASFATIADSISDLRVSK